MAHLRTPHCAHGIALLDQSLTPWIDATKGRAQFGGVFLVLAELKEKKKRAAGAGGSILRSIEEH